jgi:integrase
LGDDLLGHLANLTGNQFHGAHGPLPGWPIRCVDAVELGPLRALVTWCSLCILPKSSTAPWSKTLPLIVIPPLLRVIEVASKAAGVEGVDVHTLRHSAAVAWLEAGVHIEAVADLLGHSSIAVTGDIYGHSSDATTRAAIEGLSGTLGL